MAQNLILLAKRTSETKSSDKQITEEKQSEACEADLLLDSEFIQAAIRQIIEVITAKLHNQRSCTPKVLWNICVAISKIMDTFNEAYHVSTE